MRHLSILLAGAVLLAPALAPATARGQTPDAAAAGAPLPSVTLPAELDRVLRDYERGWTARDAEALAMLFAEDGFVLRTGHPPVRGRAAIAEAYAGVGGPLSLRALDYAMSGDVAWIVGGYASAPGETDGGKFVLALRRGEDGRWYIAADMDNVNAMPRRARPPGGGPGA